MWLFTYVGVLKAEPSARVLEWSLRCETVNGRRMCSGERAKLLLAPRSERGSVEEAKVEVEVEVDVKLRSSRSEGRNRGVLNEGRV